MFGILAVGFFVIVGVVVIFGGLTWLNARQMRALLAPYMTANQAPELPILPAPFYGGAVARPGGPVGHPGPVSGNSMRPYRTEAALAPVRWHDDGALLPALPEPATVRIGGRPEPEPATAENWTPARAPTIESDFAVPALQAVATGLAVALGVGLLAWALGWSWRVPVAVLGLALAGSWLWRLGVADSLLWAVESFTGKDLDNDQHVGRPQIAFPLANPATARQTVAQEVRAATASQAQVDLLAFVDRCFMVGTAEGKHGVTAAGPDRTAYLAKRDALLGLGVARWKNPERPKAGWEMACSRRRARQLVEKHTF